MKPEILVALENYTLENGCAELFNNLIYKFYGNEEKLIEIKRENYANIPFNIKSGNNFLFLHAQIVIKERKGCA